MSKPATPLFAQLDRMQLHKVSGGSAKSKTDQMTTLLSSVTDSIKDLAKNKTQQDPMQMVMMMMMMGGGSRGGGAAPAAAVAAPPSPVVNISTSVRR